MELSGEELYSSERLEIGFTVLCKSGRSYYIYQDGSDIISERVKKMTKRKELTIYGIVLAVIIAGAFTSYSFKKTATCCEEALSGDVVWETVNPPEDSTSGFGGLVWAKTRNGIQLRFGYTIAEGIPWTPLKSPTGTYDSRQAASLRALFGGGR